MIKFTIEQTCQPFTKFRTFDSDIRIATIQGKHFCDSKATLSIANCWQLYMYVNNKREGNAAVSRQQWWHEHATLLSYTFTACLVKIMLSETSITIHPTSSCFPFLRHWYVSKLYSFPNFFGCFLPAARAEPMFS